MSGAACGSTVGEAHLADIDYAADAGTSVPGGGIPEPATLALLTLGSLPVLLRRKRR